MRYRAASSYTFQSIDSSSRGRIFRALSRKATWPSSSSARGHQRVHPRLACTSNPGESPTPAVHCGLRMPCRKGAQTTFCFACENASAQPPSQQSPRSIEVRALRNRASQQKHHSHSLVQSTTACTIHLLRRPRLCGARLVDLLQPAVYFISWY